MPTEERIEGRRRLLQAVTRTADDQGLRLHDVHWVEVPEGDSIEVLGFLHGDEQYLVPFDHEEVDDVGRTDTVSRGLQSRVGEVIRRARRR